MRTMNFFYLLVTILITSNSCKKDNDERLLKLPVGQNIYPLEVGNYWEYGNTRDQVDSIVNSNGFDYFMVVTFPLNIEKSNGRYFVDTAYYRNEGNKTLYKHRLIDEDILLFDFSMAKGDEILIPYNFEPERNDSEKIFLSEKYDTVRLNTTIVDSCYRFYYDVIQWVDEEHTIWVRPYLGIVKSKSNAWGIGDWLTKANINGSVKEFK